MWNNKKLVKVLEINSNQLLINYGKAKLDICTFSNRTYSFSHLPAFLKKMLGLSFYYVLQKTRTL